MGVDGIPGRRSVRRVREHQGRVGRAHWKSKSSKRTFGRLAYDNEDIQDEVDLHVRAKLLDREKEVTERWLRRVLKNKLFDLRRMGKRHCRPVTESLVVDGEAGTAHR